MLGGLADYHRKRATEVGEMPAVGDGNPPLYEFFNDDDVPPVSRRLSVNHGISNDALDVHHVHPKPLSDQHAHLAPPATITVGRADSHPATLNKRTSIHHISPPTTAATNTRRRSTINPTPVKKRSFCIQHCCEILVLIIVVGVLLVLLGMLLEAKVLCFFHPCSSSAPFCPFGAAMLSTTTGNQSTHDKALQMVVINETACRTECESIPSCERAVFAGAEGNKCYLELTDAVDSTGQYMTCLKSRSDARNCPNNMPCKAWIKMCQCPQLDQEIDYATTKTLLDDVAFALQCTHIDIGGEEYLFSTCIPISNE